MADPRIYYPQPLAPGVRINQTTKSAITKQEPVKSGSSFSQVLHQEINDVKFSQHALQRLQTRNIQLNQQDLQKLNQAVIKAADKGCRESLIMVNDLALVVSIRNKTVITAVDGNNIKENVFTNIDSAIFA